MEEYLHLIYQQKYCIHWDTENKDFKPVEGVLHPQFLFLLVRKSGNKIYSLTQTTEDCI